MTHEIKVKIKQNYFKAGVLLFVSLIILITTYFALMPKIDLLEANDNKNISKEIESSYQKLENFELAIEMVDKKFSDLVVDKELFITELGSLAAENQLEICELSVQEIEIINNSTISALPVQIAVKGEVEQIALFLASIKNNDRIILINQISYRLENQPYAYMDRVYDAQSFIAWVDEVHEIEVEETEPQEEMTKTSIVDTLMNTEDAQGVCYIMLDLIGESI